MGKLHIGSSDDLYRLYDPVCLFLKAFLAFLGDGQHGGRAEGVAGVDA